MKAIIILGFSVLTTAVYSQQEQIQQVFTNNISNLNVQYRGNLNNSNEKVNFIQTNISLANNRAVQSQQQVSNKLKATPARRYTQVKVTNTNKNVVTAQVRRANPRPRPSVVNTVPQNVDINAAFDNNQALGNEFDPVVQTVNFISNEDIQVQNLSNVSNEGSNPFSQQDNTNVGSQINFNLDLSLNLKGRSTIKARSSSSSSSSTHSKSRTFSKKMAKLKRNFLGKLSSHKKGNHRLDMCFNWK